MLSDALNHASIIDGIRLCKAARYRYAHADMDDLEAKLKEAASARLRLIATDGVFSMDGDIAPLDRIVELARAHDALVMVDDSHATGFIGATGRGSIGALRRAGRDRRHHQHARQGARRRLRRVHRRARDRSWSCCGSAHGRTCSATRCRLSLAAAGLAVLERLDETTELRDRLAENTAYFRDAMTAAGFDIRPGVHPIVPIMLYEARAGAGRWPPTCWPRGST